MSLALASPFIVASPNPCQEEANLRANYPASDTLLDSNQCAAVKESIASIHEVFAGLVHAYYEHLSGYHNIYAGYRVREPYYPDTVPDFFAEGADYSRFQGLSTCIDSLTLDMCLWVGNFNSHLKKHHPDVPELNIPFFWAMPRVYMTYQEYLVYKLERMVRLLEEIHKGLNNHHMEEHFDSNWSYYPSELIEYELIPESLLNTVTDSAYQYEIRKEEK